MSLADVMDMLGLSRQAVKRLIDSGELPAAKISGQFRFYPTEVLAFVDRRRVRV